MIATKLVTMREALASPDYFGAYLPGESWAKWRVLLIAIMGEPLDDAELVVFRELTGREASPLAPVREFWAAIGRRGGKTRAIAVLAVFLACCCDHRAVLAPGERGVLPLLAASTVQAAQAFNFISGLIATVPRFTKLLRNETADTIELHTGVDIRVRPASWRTIRGITAIGAIGDEIAFWRDETSANPDVDIVDALRPGLATTSGPFIGISSPYARKGLLWSVYKQHYGPDGEPDILVAQAGSQTLNPSLSSAIVERAYRDDPVKAASEYGGAFRGDLEVFIGREKVDACTDPGVTERGYISKYSYSAFCDPSGGALDSMTLAIGHSEGEKAVLDLVREKRAPFNPEVVVEEFAKTLKSYNICFVKGDRYAGEWPRQAFSRRGIEYRVADYPKSQIYAEFLPPVNAGNVVLLDNERLATQLVSLERRTSRSGRDSIDHATGAHDDLANAVAGVLIAPRRKPPVAQVGTFRVARGGNHYSSPIENAAAPDWYKRGDKYPPGDPRWNMDLHETTRFR